MKKVLILLSISSALLLASCNNDSNLSREECIATVLSKFDMEPYQGQAISCEFHLIEFEYKSASYFMLASYCADIVASPVDCEGNKICDNNIMDDCTTFFEKAVEKGIVGIEKRN